jgi:hypothetical protein
VSGYFIRQNAVCLVTLMVAENALPSPTAVRLRVMLDPGQVAGIDSEEGKSINMVCGEGATTLAVNVGERSTLVAQQSLAVANTISERVQRVGFDPAPFRSEK